jgi:hypothetical protein
MLKHEAKQDKISLIYTPKKRGRFVLLNYLNLFIDIPIVAEVERFRSTAGSLLAFQAQRTLICYLLAIYSFSYLGSAEKLY